MSLIKFSRFINQVKCHAVPPEIFSFFLFFLQPYQEKLAESGNCAKEKSSVRWAVVRRKVSLKKGLNGPALF
jgi:hypothetical protein